MHLFEEFTDIIQEDLAWAAKRPTTAHAAAGHVPTWSVNLPEGSQSFELALNRMETDFLSGYELKCGSDPYGYAAQLNQSAERHPQHSKGKLLHTLIKNMEIVFTRRLPVPRWMQGMEALQVQHVRCDPRLRALLGPRFAAAPISSVHLPLHSRTNKSLRMAAGNTMDVWSILIASVHHWAFANPLSCQR